MTSSAYEGASAEAIQRHYDLSNDFYALWLDPTMTYSCALWDLDDPDDSLQRAQERKLDLLAGWARAPGADRVLDVGCGWGSLLRRLVGQHGVRSGTGLTLSQAQADYIADAAPGGVEIRVENWIDHRPEQPYDAIISIGAFEHFAAFGMRREERVAAYRAFFEACGSWLPSGGRLVVQSIAKGNNIRLGREMTRDLLFIVDRIFTESELPWASEILLASERIFDVVKMRNDAPHYARTCATWLHSLRAAESAARELTSDEVFTDYVRYLQACVTAFERRHAGLLRIAFEVI